MHFSITVVPNQSLGEVTRSYLQTFVTTSAVAPFTTCQLAVLFVLPLWPLVRNWFESMFLCFSSGWKWRLGDCDTDITTQTHKHGAQTPMCLLCTERAHAFTQARGQASVHTPTLTHTRADYTQEHPQWGKHLIWLLCLASVDYLDANQHFRCSCRLLVQHTVEVQMLSS